MKSKPAVNHEAWANSLIGFIRAKGLEQELTDWCGGFPCPIKAGGDVAMPQNVEVAIRRMRTLADSALGSLYEVECQREMRNACILLEDAYRSRIPAPAQPRQEPDDWQDDPSADERWNAGLDFGMVQLCAVLGVDPHMVNWDAATETLDGDVCAAIGNIFRTKYGEDFDPTASTLPSTEGK